MEASAVPREAPTGARLLVHPQLVRRATDGRLVALVRAGHPAAFEALYERYHRPVLALCLQLLGDRTEAEDVVQHTFLAAWGDLVRRERPIHLRAWLFTIARNRCLSLLRARREHPVVRLGELASEGPAVILERRQDLRNLVADLRRLPDDQRRALVLAEFDARSHAEIARALDVPRPKVKALVFQARESLLATRLARETACEEIRRQLAVARGAALRRATLRRHLRDCASCRQYRALVDRRDRQLPD